MKDLVFNLKSDSVSDHKIHFNPKEIKSIRKNNSKGSLVICYDGSIYNIEDTISEISNELKYNDELEFTLIDGKEINLIIN